MTKREVDEQIHLALGWKKIKWPQVAGQDTIGCDDGWCWESPTGTHYEGHMGMVPHYVDALAEAACILPALLTVCTSNNSASGPAPASGAGYAGRTGSAGGES